MMRHTKKNVAAAANELLEKLYPDAVCSLVYDGDPWRLLVMARLSAQCTDARVNIVSVPLFAKYPTAADMAVSDPETLESIVRPCGLYHTKARDLRRMSEQIVRDFGGRVPDTMDKLLSLAGVGRKIANLILGDVYGKGGIVADTHCICITGRLGLTASTVPAKVEKDVEVLLPREKQSAFCHRLVLFGRDICSARSPKCEECELKKNGVCRYNKEGKTL